MKKLFYFLVALFSLGLVVTACSKDVTMDTTTPSARSYNKDAEILTKFVDINKTEGEYYINDSKKVSILSYITDKDLKELQLVNPLNRAKFESNLTVLNSQLASVAQRGDVAQIVYSTYGETWIRTINEDDSFIVEEGVPLETRAARADYGTWTLEPGYTTYMSFSGNNQIRSVVQINIFGFTYYFFEIISKIDASKTGSYSGEGGNNSRSIVFSGTGPVTNEPHTFTWKPKSSSSWLNWDFEGIQHSPSSPGDGNISVHFTD